MELSEAFGQIVELEGEHFKNNTFKLNIFLSSTKDSNVADLCLLG